jgi:hypothetical protein
LVGPVSSFAPAGNGPRANRRARSRPYSHAREIVDLQPISAAPRGSAVKRLEAIFRRHPSGTPDLLALAAATLHAFSSRGFRWIDHWEVAPHGWLPLPGEGDRKSRESLGQLLTLLRDGGTTRFEGATSFAARLSDTGGGRADIVLRSRRRSGRNALTMDLYGTWSQSDLAALHSALAGRLPVEKVRLDRFQYAD